MSRPVRFGSAMSLVALASVIGGCAGPSNHVATASGFGGKANGEVGLATRALAALNTNNIPMAIDYAERAVERTPNDAGFRALLGSAYFAAGRFKSAEGAYKDALALYSNQPQVVLKLALVEIAQGKNSEAMAFLDAGRSVLDPADYGLAMALAGHPAEAIAVLQDAARAPDADARVRQNLALSYALAGDWTNARTVAAQDVPGDQLDARIHQWMQMATPGQQSTAVASLVGVTPAAVDPGQPVRLALRETDTRTAQMTPTSPQGPATPEPQQQPQVAQATVTLPPVVEAPAPAPVAVAEAAPPPEPMPFVEVRKPSKAEKPTKVAKAVAAKAPVQRASAEDKPAPVRTAELRRGGSSAVVQLGAFSNPDSVLVAWDKRVRRFRSLAGYTPMSARFASPKGTFYRLSVKGFGSLNEAEALCASVKRAGGSCFVRNVAGDTPVQIASR